jgi:hypothetical protein
MFIARFADHLQQWLEHPEQLSKWMAFLDCQEHITNLGLDPLTEQIYDGRVPVSAAEHTFALAYYESLLREQMRQTPLLARFDGGAHSRVVDRFIELDRTRIAASTAEVVREHHRRIPVGGGVGPVNVLRSEIVKKSRHLPIRQLMQKAAPVIQALKPVMMMSPLSVAQFLPPGKLTFDLLVMDEASQIQPVDALGAIARCRQLVVQDGGIEDYLIAGLEAEGGRIALASLRTFAIAISLREQSECIHRVWMTCISKF